MDEDKSVVRKQTDAERLLAGCLRDFAVTAADYEAAAVDGGVSPRDVPYGAAFAVALSRVHSAVSAATSVVLEAEAADARRAREELAGLRREKFEWHSAREDEVERRLNAELQTAQALEKAKRLETRNSVLEACIAIGEPSPCRNCGRVVLLGTCCATPDVPPPRVVGVSLEQYDAVERRAQQAEETAVYLQEELAAARDPVDTACGCDGCERCERPLSGAFLKGECDRTAVIPDGKCLRCYGHEDHMAHAPLDRLLGHPVVAAPETKEKRYYVVTVENGVEVVDSEKEAREIAQSEIEGALDDGWHENVGQVEWGEFIERGQAVQTEYKETPDGEHDYACNYVLVDVPQHAGVLDDAANEIVSARPFETSLPPGQYWSVMTREHGMVAFTSEKAARSFASRSDDKTEAMLRKLRKAASDFVNTNIIESHTSECENFKNATHDCDCGFDAQDKLLQVIITSTERS